MHDSEGEQNRERGIAEMGSMMLKGWVMTNDTCPAPSCDFPLLRTKDSARWVCVVHGEQAVGFQNSTKAQKSALSKNSVPKAAEADAEAAFNALLAEKTDQQAEWQDIDDGELIERSNIAQSEVSSRIGQKLLQGWTLLAEECPNCDSGVPLMRNPTTGRDFCVRCDEYINDSKQKQSSSRGSSLVVSFNDSMTITEEKQKEKVKASSSAGKKHSLDEDSDFEDLMEEESLPPSKVTSPRLRKDNFSTNPQTEVPAVLSSTIKQIDTTIQALNTRMDVLTSVIPLGDRNTLDDLRALAGVISVYVDLRNKIAVNNKNH
ncbi:hypothetical protein BJ742DRAFT_779851 [Cladochytrium replicatum]|nr:hypothetical protein BJ742DRAFT_779851 [Cladochytrium replicatum]